MKRMADMHRHIQCSPDRVRRVSVGSQNQDDRGRDGQELCQPE